MSQRRMLRCRAIRGRTVAPRQTSSRYLTLTHDHHAGNPMIKPVRTVLAAALALATAPAFAQTYSQTIFFGDSLTDSGHFRPALVQAVGPNGALLGRFTTNPG